ncbi:MAG: Npt1/Npt2 family nucleotide transporter [Thermoanaerobaculia bacterium]
MSNAIARLFNLQRGDGRRGTLLFAYLFLIITCYQLGKMARDALFLSAFKASKLPYADMTIALSVGVAVAVYLMIGRRTRPRNLMVGCLLAFAVLQCGFWYLATFRPELRWQFPVLYVWIGVFGVLAPTQVWMLANYLLTTREAKRVFGLVGAGGITGWIFSGLLASALARTRGLGTKSLLLVMAIILLGCAGLVVALWREKEKSPAAGATPHGEGESKSLRESLAVVFSSPYLIAIASLITLSSIVTSFAGWQFKAIAKNAYPNTNDLTAFFGQFNFWAGLACLGLQLLVTSRFLRRFGLGPALLLVPLALFGGELAVLALGTLGAAILLKGSDQVLRYSIDKSSVELLYLPVPAEIKLQAKSSIDTVIWRFGDGLAGLTLAVFTDRLLWSPQRVSLVNLFFIVGWVSTAVLARRRYLHTLLQSIRQRRLDAERQFAPVLDRSTADLLAKQLTSSDPGEVLYALEVFGVSPGRETHPGVRDLLGHQEPAVRRRALELLDAAGDLWALPRVEEMLRDPEVEVRSAALLFLAHHAPSDPLRRIKELDAFQDVSVVSGIVTFLVHSGGRENLPEARMLMDRMISQGGEAGKRARLEAASLIGMLGDEFDGGLDALLADEEPEVVRAAVRAAGKLSKRRVAPKLIGLLGDARVREEAANVLAAMGDRVLGALRDQLRDGNAPLAARLEVPGVLARVGNQGAANALAENLLDSDLELRFRTICALNDLRSAHPKTVIDPARLNAALGFEMMLLCRTSQILSVAGRAADAQPGAAQPTEVIRRLQASHDQEIERIFRILSLRYPGTDFRSAHYGLRSSDPTARDHALEFLELSLDRNLRKTLVSLLDPTTPLDERVIPILRRTGVEAPTAGELVAALVESEDPWLKACGISSVGALGLRELAGQVEACLDAEDELLRETARAAKRQLAAATD